MKEIIIKTREFFFSEPVFHHSEGTFLLMKVICMSAILKIMNIVGYKRSKVCVYIIIDMSHVKLYITILIDT